MDKITMLQKKNQENQFLEKHNSDDLKTRCHYKNESGLWIKSKTKSIQDFDLFSLFNGRAK